jgi:hypothetical protein
VLTISDGLSGLNFARKKRLNACGERDLRISFHPSQRVCPRNCFVISTSLRFARGRFNQKQRLIKKEIIMFTKSGLKMSAGLIDQHTDDDKQRGTEADLPPRDGQDDPLAIMW